MRPRLFIYNINRSYRIITPETIYGLLMYPVRKLLSTRNRDLIWLPRAFEEMADAVFAHLNAAGVYPTRNIIFADDWHEIDIEGLLAQGYEFHPFIMNEEMAEFSGRWDWHRATMEFERKTRFARFCLQHNIPIPGTYFEEDVERLTDADFARGLFGKLDYTASGIGMRRLFSRDEFEAWRLEYPEDEFILQEPYPIRSEFSIQMDLTERPHMVEITGQHIGKQNEHIGNFHHPGLAATLRIDRSTVGQDALLIAAAMKEAGITNRVGKDLMANGSWGYALGEANCRDTGATFAIDGAHALGVPAWSYKNVLTTARSVEELDLDGNNPLFYRPGQDTGLVVINAGPTAYGKLSVMIIGDPSTWASQESEYRSWLECDKAEAMVAKAA